MTDQQNRPAKATHSDAEHTSGTHDSHTQDTVSSGDIRTKAVPLPGPSLDSGGGPGDGRAHHGFTGDDGEHVPGESKVRAPSLQPGLASDLGGEQDPRAHGIPDDPAERTTGADAPNDGGIAGAAGGPRESGPIPGEDDDEDSTTGGGQSGNDPQRDPQI